MNIEPKPNTHMPAGKRRHPEGVVTEGFALFGACMCSLQARWVNAAAAFFTCR